MQFFKYLEYLLLNKRSICKQLYSFIFLPITYAFSIPEPWVLLCFSLYILLSCNTACVRDAVLLDLRLPSSSCAPSNCHSMPWGFPSPICLKSLARCYLHCVTSIMRKCGQIFIMQFSLKRKSKSFPFASLSSPCASLVLCNSCHWNRLLVLLHLIDSPSQFEILLGEEKGNSPSSYRLLLSGAVEHLWWDLCIRGWLITMLYQNKSFDANTCSWFCFSLPSCLEFGMVSLIFSAALAYFPSRPPFPPSVAAASQRLSYRRSFCRLLR